VGRIVPLMAKGFASALDPAGPGAERLAVAWWVMFVLGSVVFVGVLVLYARALWRRRDPEALAGGARVGERTLIVFGGIVFTGVVLVGMMVLTLWSGTGPYGPSGAEFRAGDEQVAEARVRDERRDALEVEVIGHQFWWEVRYDDQAITANEIHIPVGRDVRIIARTADVIHAIWVPELGGKVDTIPGKTNALTIRSDRAGEFVGKCAEYCGIQHALMEFRVIAQEPAEFEAWLTRERRPAGEPRTESQQRGFDEFFSNTCDDCHAIRGTPADAREGPDLTHLASRRTLGAGVVPNNRGNLGGWIVDPHGIKPGNPMPPSKIDSQRLQDLLDYMEALE
jgi:cytochrome c oxidase subunit II